MFPKKILFMTGTRAEYSKLKSLINILSLDPSFEVYIFVTGMHTLRKYGLTEDEIKKAGYKNIHVYLNQIEGEPMDLILANTITGFSRYVNEYKPDMIIIHGDRIEALACAIVGALRNIIVAHIEGGEKSGTIDDIIRHTISKLANIHFVANQEACTRLIQMGENPKNVNVIGSPEIDIMLHSDLPNLIDVKKRYDIEYIEYSIALFHSVTTELENLPHDVEQYVSALIESDQNYVVIYPNNDEGCEKIFNEYKRLEGNSKFKLLPSLRHEYFLTLLKNADFIIGNSSSGIREASIYLKYAINIGTRQNKRFNHPSIINVKANKQEILDIIKKIPSFPTPIPTNHFGNGKSAEQFSKVLKTDSLWNISKQKEFLDIYMPNGGKSSGKN